VSDAAAGLANPPSMKPTIPPLSSVVKNSRLFHHVSTSATTATAT
jgi:hypothetical protein